MRETSKSKRGRPQTLDAENVLDVAMNAYWTGDPADVSVNAVCGMAAASKPAIYRAFGNEDGLMLAALNRYADEVLFNIFTRLTPETSLRETLDALIRFCAEDPKMETGCLFYKMRAGKHRHGPQTRERITEIEAVAVDAFTDYLETCRTTGTWESAQPSRLMARYLVDQIGLAFTQRAAGENPAQVQQSLSIALSVF